MAWLVKKNHYHQVTSKWLLNELNCFKESRFNWHSTELKLKNHWFKLWTRDLTAKLTLKKIGNTRIKLYLWLILFSYAILWNQLQLIVSIARVRCTTSLLIFSTTVYDESYCWKISQNSTSSCLKVRLSELVHFLEIVNMSTFTHVNQFTFVKKWTRLLESLKALIK